MRMNGCYNRAPLQEKVVVQDGWRMEENYRVAMMITIPDPMTKDCQYSLTNDDPRCNGCKHKQELIG